jgi:hypothetical protein
VAFAADLVSTSGGSSDNRGVFRGDGSSITQIARESQNVPDGNGRFGELNRVTLNDAGQTAFFAMLTATSGGAGDDSGLYRGDGTTLVRIAREGQTAPDGNGKFSTFGTGAINNAGQVAFSSQFTNTVGGNQDRSGLYIGNGIVLTQVARANQAVPGGNGRFLTIQDVALNNAGDLAFSAQLEFTSGGTTDNSGIFLKQSEVGSIAQIVREGQLVPNGNGRFSSFNSLSLNVKDQIVFYAILTGTSGPNDTTAIFRSGGGTITQIARTNQLAPDGNGRFSNLDDTSFNDAGQIAFHADLSSTIGGISDNEGVFAFDDRFGMLQIARKGDSLLNSTIATLQYLGSIGPDGDELGGLNNRGEIVYGFTLSDGRWGLAVAAIVPEPALNGIFATFAIMGFAVERRRRSREL